MAGVTITLPWLPNSSTPIYSQADQDGLRGQIINGLVGITDIAATYEGSFRMPRGDFSTSQFAFEHGTNNIYAANYKNGNMDVYQATMPALKITEDWTALNVATEVQAPVSFQPKIPSTSWTTYSTDDTDGGLITGMYHDGTNLIVQGVKAYDPSGTPYQQCMFAIDTPSNLSTSAVRGDFGLYDTAVSDQAGRLANRWISDIPTSKQASLGGATHFFGSSHGAIPGSGTLSKGPSLFTGDIADLSGASNGGTINVVGRMYWKPDWMIADVFNYGGSIGGTNNDLWNKASDAAFGMIIPGTKVVFFIGSQAGHKPGSLAYTQATISGYVPESPGLPCTNPYSGISVLGQTNYGEIAYKNTSDPPQAPLNWEDKYGNVSQGGFNWDNAVWTAYVWLYNLDDITGAAAVTDPRPIEYGEIVLPFDTRNVSTGSPGLRIEGGDYDPINNKLRLSTGFIQNPLDLQNSQETIILSFDFSSWAAQE